MRTPTKILPSVAVAVVMSVAGARATGVHGCTAPGVSHVSARVGERPVTPIACCEGQIRCSQFLATTVVIRPPSNHRS